MSYITKDFLLNSPLAVSLYEKYAKDMPIFDYHCHLSEKEILEDKQFSDIYDLWLSADHYKWRLLRNYGVDESYITGDKSKKEKFIKYCEVLSKAFGNPLYHWSQLELETYFDCTLEINKENAEAIWNTCNKVIQDKKLTPSKLIKMSNVKRIFTTNEIFDDLEVFNKIKNKFTDFTVAPAFRADKIMNIEADKYLEYLSKLGNISSLDELESTIENRLQEFKKAGCVASDISLQRVLPISSKEEADKVFVKRLSGKALDNEEANVFKGYLTYFLFKLYAKNNISTELHIGVIRNNNTDMFNKIGADTGYDSIAEDNSINNMSKLFNTLNSENMLPRTIVFNLNPKMNLEILTLLGCFQDSSVKGKMQFGAAWWFLDNKAGIEKNLTDMTSVGHLDAFIGMLTDSRSFLSYTRHYYFRRILCNYLAELVNKGEITNDENILKEVINNICFYNAINYFGEVK